MKENLAPEKMGELGKDAPPVRWQSWRTRRIASDVAAKQFTNDVPAKEAKRLCADLDRGG